MFLYTCRNLNANNIGIIENGSLDNLTLLEELRLNKNNLTQLKDLFTNLGKLRKLYAFAYSIIHNIYKSIKYHQRDNY